MLRRIQLFIYTLLALPAIHYSSIASPADSACAPGSCCCGSDLSPAGIMISHLHSKKEWMFSYRLMHMRMEGLQQGSQRIGSEAVFSQYLVSPEQMQMDMHMVMGMYGLTERLTLMGMLNYNRNSMQMQMYSSSIHHHGGADAGPSDRHMSMQTPGFGDVKLYALYGLMKKHAHELLLSGGLSVPTGSIQQKGATNDMLYPGSRLPYMMQTGSGTWDLLPGITYLYQHERVQASMQTTAVIRTGSNSASYRLGNEYTVNAWAAWRWLRFLSSSLRLEGIAVDAISGRDAMLYTYAEPAANAANYGGKVLSAYIGSALHLGKGLLRNNSLALEYGIPIAQSCNGIQLQRSYMLNASLSIGF